MCCRTRSPISRSISGFLEGARWRWRKRSKEKKKEGRKYDEEKNLHRRRRSSPSGPSRIRGSLGAQRKRKTVFRAGEKQAAGGLKEGRPALIRRGWGGSGGGESLSFEGEERSRTRKGVLSSGGYSRGTVKGKPPISLLVRRKERLVYTKSKYSVACLIPEPRRSLEKISL